jgi:hypothetical protein
VQAEGVNDIYRVYYTARKDGADFKLAYVGPDFDASHPYAFDKDYMRSLFEYGHRLGSDGSAWHASPPGEGTQSSLAPSPDR